jgi:cyclic-di-AMP phosphodiesterase PgpH
MSLQNNGHVETSMKYKVFNIASLIVFSGLIFISLVFSTSARPTTFSLEIGNVASQDFQAPRAISFESAVLTEQARIEAEIDVSPVYLPTDPSISRQQIERLQVTGNFISSVRSDIYATTDQKLTDLSSLSDVQLQPEVADQILNLSSTRWQAVQDETIRVLEQVMRSTIRDEQVTNAQSNVSTLISYSMPEDQAVIIEELVRPFVKPNSLFSQELTETSRKEASESIEPVIMSYISGETIIRRGQIITPITREALEQYGLISPSSNNKSLLAALLISVLLSIFFSLYFRNQPGTLIISKRSRYLILISLLVFLFTARAIIPEQPFLAYLFPLPAFGLTIASLFSIELGLFFSFILSILAGFGITQGQELSIYYLILSICGMLVLRNGRRVSAFFWSGLAIAIAGTSVILAYRIQDISSDSVFIVTLIGAAIVNGLASSSLTLLLQNSFAQFLGLTTNIQLLDISRPDHPLLQIMLTKAPGTYQHSLQVANLAERAAAAIGADSLLTRIGATFHDAGKANNPSYFIENKLPGIPNPHEELDPATSSSIIIQHVKDSTVLAKKYRVPQRIQDFMREHHGTLVTRYQYTQAQEASGDHLELVDIEDFRYPGPAPRSCETAILMLADQCEARARADLPADEDELRKIVAEQVAFCQREGQLDNTDLTLHDIKLIIESFVHTLKNTLHMRIKYPQLNLPENSKTEIFEISAAKTEPSAVRRIRRKNKPK